MLEKVIQETPDQVLVNETKLKIVNDIKLHGELAISPFVDFDKFHSLSVPLNAQVGEMASSRNNAAIFKFTYLDKQNNLHSVPVVIKKMESFRLENELKTYNRLNKLKPNFTRFQVAFYVDKGKEAYFATVIKPDLMPLSSKIQTIFRESSDEKMLLRNYEFSIGQGVLALLRLHCCGIKHRDAFPKNIGIDSQNADVFAYDFEHTELTQDLHTPLSMEESVREIENIFLARCFKFAKEGDMTDGIFHNKEEREILERQKAEHKILLDKLGIRSPLVFMNINIKMIEKVKELYNSGVFKEGGWTPELETDIHFKLTGKYPANSGIYTHEFVDDLIGNAGSLS
jgi:serine/threonine protein kinase